MTNVITGIYGSGASYLAEMLVKQKKPVIGLARWHSNGHNKNIDSLKNEMNVIECDLTDLSATVRALKLAKPTCIYNMASHANVRASFDNPISVLDNNIKITINLFEALKILNVSPIIHHVSTSEVYGIVEQSESPIKEEHPLNPVNIYSVSKMTQEKICYAYHNSDHFKVIITRCFSYICPRREDIFTSAFARQIIEIEKGKREVLVHGNLNSVRTLMDVRDMSSAYIESTEKCSFGEPYNIGGSNTLSVGDFLEKLKEKAKVKIKTEVDPKLLRPIDINYQVPDCTKFYAKTNWEPKISLDQSIEDLLQYYRERI